ncbi:MAG: DNA alkylation repair protein [Sphingobacteriia bacterium]|jgi:3-methyladenine DNA glycosylase AlkD
MKNKAPSDNAADYCIPLIHAFKKAANPTEARGMKAYMLNQFDFLGIKAPIRDSIVFPFIKNNPILSTEQLVEVVEYLWNLPYREYQYAAIDVFAKNHSIWNEKSHQLIESCTIHRSWWDTVDGIASDWLSIYFKKYPTQIISVTSKWNRSKNIWLQRNSILFQKKCKADMNTQLLSQYILHVKDSKEFFIQKAIGWALREYSKTNPQWVKAFVSSNELAPLSKREALKIINK